MDDFGKIVYLDVQKTGSTYINQFLKDNLALDQREFVKHGRVTGKVDPDTFYFISVRNPFAQWLSLYQFGCDKKGPVRKRLRKQDGGSFDYSGTLSDFENWLTFALDPKKAAAFGGGYADAAPELYGLQTYRFLVLCLRTPIRALKNAQTRERLLKVYEKRQFSNFTLRTETLRQDLVRLSAGPFAPYLIDRQKTEDYLDRTKDRNTSSAVKFDITDVSPDLRKLLRDRDWFLFEKFYPDANPA